MLIFKPLAGRQFKSKPPSIMINYSKITGLSNKNSVESSPRVSVASSPILKVVIKSKNGKIKEGHSLFKGTHFKPRATSRLIDEEVITKSKTNEIISLSLN